MRIYDSLNFLVFGDWGGTEIPPYTTEAELLTASGMQRVGSQYDSHFAISLGDNFYHSGVIDENDSRFQTTFEAVFTGPNLQRPNFFRVLSGNHDHSGNVSAQIAYSDVSSRWMYPDYFYDFTEAAGEFTVQVIMLDTVILAGSSSSSAGEHELKGSELTGPADHHVLLKDAQMTYLANTLAASTADHVIVAGHYPVWSVCEHGPTGLLVSEVKPLLEKYNVSVYLSGHDHCAEVIADSGVVYHGIGSAGYSDPSLEHISDVPEGSLKYHNDANAVGGFARIEVDGVTGDLTVEHFDGAGSSVYVADAVAPRRNR